MKDEFLPFIEKHFFARPKIGFFASLSLILLWSFYSYHNLQNGLIGWHIPNNMYLANSYKELFVSKNYLFLIFYLIPAQLSGILLENLSFTEFIGSLAKSIGKWISKKGDIIYNKITLPFAKLEGTKLSITLPEEYKKVLQDEDVRRFLKELEAKPIYSSYSETLFEYFRFDEILLNGGREDYKFCLFNFHFPTTNLIKLTDKYSLHCQGWKKTNEKELNTLLTRLIKDGEKMKIIKELFYATQFQIKVEDLIKQNDARDVNIFFTEVIGHNPYQSSNRLDKYFVRISFNPQIFKAVMKHLRKHKLID